MDTFRHVHAELLSIEKSIQKDCSVTRNEDANSCVIKAIAIAGGVDFVTADLLARKYFNRKFKEGVNIATIRNGIQELFNSIGHNVIGYWAFQYFSDYGYKSKFFIYPDSDKISLLELNFYRRKNLTLEQVRRQSKNRCFFVIVDRHALIIKNEIIIDYIESKRRRVRYIFEIN